jgi:excisionase family DNA binding protein
MPQYLTAKEAARVLRISRATLDRWVKDGILPVIQPVPHGPRRFRRHDLDRLFTPKEDKEAS